MFGVFVDERSGFDLNAVYFLQDGRFNDVFIENSAEKKPRGYSSTTLCDGLEHEYCPLECLLRQNSVAELPNSVFLNTWTAAIFPDRHRCS